MNVAHNLRRGRLFFAARGAILFEGRTLTYRELDEASNRVANALSGLGIHRGDRVAIYLPNIPEFAIVYYGILKAGAIAVSINAIFKQQEVAFVLNDSSSRLLFTTSDLAAQLEEIECPALERVITVDRSLADLIAKGSVDTRVAEME